MANAGRPNITWAAIFVAGTMVLGQRCCGEDRDAQYYTTAPVTEHDEDMAHRHRLKNALIGVGVFVVAYYASDRYLNLRRVNIERLRALKNSLPPSYIREAFVMLESYTLQPVVDFSATGDNDNSKIAVGLRWTKDF